MRLVHRISLAAAFAWLAASPAAHAGSTLDRIAQREQLNLGYRSDAPPFSYHDDKGQPIGYSVELCRAIAQRIQTAIGKPGMKVRTIAVAADQLGRIVGSGGVDLMCAGTSDTPERRKTLDFSPPIFLSSVKFLVRDAAKYGTVAQLKGQTVAVIGRSVAEALFPDTDPLGRHLLVNNVMFQVIGVMSERGASPMGSDQDDVVFVPYETGSLRLFGQRYLRNLNYQYNNGMIDKEFYLRNDEAKTKAEFVAGKTGTFAFYLTSNTDVISATLVNNPDAEFAVLPPKANVPQGYQPQGRAYWPFGFIMGINYESSAEER